MNMFKPTAAQTKLEYIDAIDEPRRSEIVKLDALIQKNLGKVESGLFGSVIGYEKVPYKSKSGKTGEWFRVGLASQKNYISVYICAIDKEKGKYIPEMYKDWFPSASIGKSCIRFRKLDQIDLDKLAKLVSLSKKYPTLGY